jgi:hypothetical protein
MPERTFYRVRVWCWPRVPAEAIAWTVGTRGTLHLSQAPRSAGPTTREGRDAHGRLGRDQFLTAICPAECGHGWAASISWLTAMHEAMHELVSGHRG